MNRRVLGVVLLMAAAACGGGSKSSASAKASSAASDRDSAAFDERAKDNGTPGWVNRGSGAVATDEKRAFYGVGLFLIEVFIVTVEREEIPFLQPRTPIIWNFIDEKPPWHIGKISVKTCNYRFRET